MKKQFATFLLSLICTFSFAAVVTVTNTQDTGVGSLRNTCNTASSGDDIVFAQAIWGDTIRVTSWIHLGAKSLTINGHGQMTISGSNISSIFASDAFGAPAVSTVKYMNLTFIDVNVGFGQAIWCSWNINIIENCSFFNCVSTDPGGSGAAVLAMAGPTVVRIDKCTFANNGGAAHNGGAVAFYGGNMTITNSTFSKNTTAEWGGAVYINGGLPADSVTIANCTFYDNRSLWDGAAIAAVSSAGYLMLQGNTFKDNHANNLGGAVRSFSNNVHYVNNIFDNTAGVGQSNIASIPSFTSLGNNLISSHPANGTFLSSDSLNASVLVDTLADNGGATLTCKLLTGSPALDRGNNSYALPTDQRGFLRIYNATIDIGAYEAQLFTYYKDGDGDRYGDADSSMTSTNFFPPLSYVADNTDCDDGNASVNPSAAEVCNGIDDNCDGDIDEALYIISNKSERICEGDSILIAGAFRILAGTYTDTMVIVNACDSIFETQLTVNTVDTSVTSTATQLTASATSATYQWIDCATNNPISGAINQAYAPVVTGSYAVQVTENGCTAISGCHNISISTAIDFEQISGYEIYPNPASGLIFFDNNNVDILSIEILTIEGKKIKSQEIHEGINRIYIAGLAEGLYFVKVYTKDTYGMRKLIVTQ